MSVTTQAFRAPHSQAALEAVRRALGPNALIVSTRPVPPESGTFPWVEVLAAPEEPPAASRVGPAWQRMPNAPPAFWDARPEDGGSAEMERWLAPHELWLTDLGVAPRTARMLLQRASMRAGAGRLHMFREALLETVEEQLPCAAAPWLGSDPAVLALVGPTGVGKTTTLVKMAAQARSAGRSVALISTDTFRTGARDVLARYGQVLGVPVTGAALPHELREALDAFAGVDLVLVDSAGRSDASSLERQAGLLGVRADVRTVLVLSAVASHQDITDTMLRCVPLRPAGVVFTKLDEARAPGCLLSAGLTRAVPLWGHTDGPRIPDDLHRADAAALAARMVR